MLRSIQFCFLTRVYLSSWGIICHQFSGSSCGVCVSVCTYTRLLLWRFSWDCASKNIFLKRSWTFSALYGVFGLALFQGTAETEKKRNLTLQSVGSYSLFCHFPGGAKAHQVVCDAVAWWSGSALPSDSWAVLILQSWEIRDGILNLHYSRTFLWTRSAPKVLLGSVLVKGWCHLHSGLLCLVLLSGQVLMNVNGCLFLIFWSPWAI